MRLREADVKLTVARELCGLAQRRDRFFVFARRVPCLGHQPQVTDIRRDDITVDAALEHLCRLVRRLMQQVQVGQVDDDGGAGHKTRVIQGLHQRQLFLGITQLGIDTRQGQHIGVFRIMRDQFFQHADHALEVAQFVVANAQQQQPVFGGHSALLPVHAYCGFNGLQGATVVLFLEQRLAQQHVNISTGLGYDFHQAPDRGQRSVVIFDGELQLSQCFQRTLLQPLGQFRLLHHGRIGPDGVFVTLFQVVRVTPEVEYLSALVGAEFLVPCKFLQKPVAL